MKTPRILFISFLLFMWAGMDTFAQQSNNAEALLNDLHDKVVARLQMLTDYQKNGQQFKDTKAFFLNEMGFVKTADTFLRLAKGKKDLEANVVNVEIIVPDMVTNLYVGACQFVYSEPAVAVQLFEEYFRAVASPQFSKLKLTAIKEAYYVYATALEDSNGDKTKIEAALKESLTSDFGIEACLKLQMIYHNRGDYDSAIRVADIVIARINDGTIKDNENTLYLFNHKAAALFNKGQYDKAYLTFAETDAKYPGHIELMTQAGQSAIKHALLNESVVPESAHFFKESRKGIP